VTDRSRRVTTTQPRLRAALRSVVLVAALLAAPAEARGQFADSVRIAVGTRVWVRMKDGAQREWRFERATSDSLTLRRRSHESDELLSVPWSDAERLDTMVIGRPPARRILTGSAIGGLVGLAVAYIGATSGHCHAELSCSSVGFAILAPEIVGAGALIGGMEGYVHRNWHWSTAWRAP